VGSLEVKKGKSLTKFWLQGKEPGTFVSGLGFRLKKKGPGMTIG